MDDDREKMINKRKNGGAFQSLQKINFNGEAQTLQVILNLLQSSPHLERDFF